MMKKIGLTCMVLCLWAVFFITFHSNAAAEPKGEPIKVGVLQPVSGPMSMYGAPAAAAMQYAAMNINKEGGILGRPVEILVRDTKANVEVGLREIKSLIFSEGCMFVGGFLSSAAALAASNYIKELNGKAFLTVYCASSSPITEEYGHRYVSRVGTNNIYWQRVVTYDSLMRWPDSKRCYQINANYVYGQTCAKEFKRIYAELMPGCEMVGEAWPPLGTKDFSSYISAIVAAKPDLIQTSLYGADAITFLKQLAPYGYKGNIIGQDMGLQETRGMFKRGDVGVPLGVLGGAYTDFWYDKDPKQIAFNNYVYEKSGFYPGAMLAHPVLYILKAAMERAGTTTDLEAIIDALENRGLGTTVLDDIYGTIHMRACDHQTVQIPGYIGQVGWDKEGKIPYPILTPETSGYTDMQGLWHTCAEVMQLRKAAQAKTK